MQKKKTTWKFALVSVLSLSLFVWACASGSPPVGKLANVERDIARARESSAMVYAPLELRLAEEKLAEAKALVNQKKYVAADRLLEEALIDANLAEAISGTEKERINSTKMRETVDALRKEIERKSQAR
jgi:Domain of unknown function (DUF4398)